MLKRYEIRNLIVPVVGDFAGPIALWAIGRYLSDHDTAMEAFYTSNVETYLFVGNAYRRFVTNVGALPITKRSVFMRTLFTVTGFAGTRPGDATAMGLDPIGAWRHDVKRGTIRTSSDLRVRSQVSDR